MTCHSHSSARRRKTLVSTIRPIQKSQGIKMVPFTLLSIVTAFGVALARPPVNFPRSPFPNITAAFAAGIECFPFEDPHCCVDRAVCQCINGMFRSRYEVDFLTNVRRNILRRECDTNQCKLFALLAPGKCNLWTGYGKYPRFCC